LALFSKRKTSFDFFSLFLLSFTAEAEEFCVGPICSEPDHFQIVPATHFIRASLVESGYGKVVI
jgi:hypothetical protein